MCRASLVISHWSFAFGVILLRCHWSLVISGWVFCYLLPLVTGIWYPVLSGLPLRGVEGLASNCRFLHTQNWLAGVEFPVSIFKYLFT